MKRVLPLLLIALTSPLWGQRPISLGSGTAGQIPTSTVANLPVSPAEGTVRVVTDGADTSDCTGGGGSSRVLCEFNGIAWGAIGDGGGLSSGDVTAVTAGTGLSGGGTTGDLSISVANDGIGPTQLDETAAYTFSSSSNSFTGASGSFASLTASGPLRLTGVVTPAQIAADQNDYNPTGLSTANIIRLSSDQADRQITGLTAQTSGRQVTLINVGDYPFLIQSESANSTAANRFVFEENTVYFASGQALTLYYDGTISRWRGVGRNSLITSDKLRNYGGFFESGPESMDATAGGYLWLGIGNHPKLLGITAAAPQTDRVRLDFDVDSNVFSGLEINGSLDVDNGYYVSGHQLASTDLADAANLQVTSANITDGTDLATAGKACVRDASGNCSFGTVTAESFTLSGSAEQSWEFADEQTPTAPSSATAFKFYSDAGVPMLWRRDDAAAYEAAVKSGSFTDGNCVKYDATTDALVDAGDPCGTGSGSGIATVQEEGSDLTQRTKINFIGSSYTAADDAVNSVTKVTSDSDLDALASNSTNGLWARTGSGTGSARTLTAASSKITVTNGNGVSGNPTVDVAEANLTLSSLGGAVTDSQVPDTITVSNYLALAGGTMTGQLVTDNLGIEFAESDTNPTCSTGNFNIYADLSENKLKKCVNGTASDLDASGTGTVTATGGDLIANQVMIGAGTTDSAVDSGCSTDGAGALTCVSVASSGTNGGIDGTEGDGSNLTAAADHDLLYPDSTTHRWMMNNNNGGAIAVTGKIASGTAAMGTSTISSGACASVVTVAATGVATTDTIVYTPNADPTGVTGYAVSSSGSLYIWAYPTANNVNFKVCNNTAGSLTPGALTLNWRVDR